GSISTAATSPWASAFSSASASLYSTTRVVSLSGTGAPTLPSRATASPAGPGEGLVHAAVVAPGVHEHLRAPGDRPRQPDGPAVGVGGGQRERPLAHS